ncbi:sugar phosphate isomerase/epimerase [Actinospica sp. MGRD01-02]|uniref:Sugar phosphate isomerase/epimerase n=1 Tax=Actinospica acidithermotolerans TaxID=2828514 RepID=A0A941EA87_9ACTN|nr:sugar phosphate isomerase/epimerase family protein [Actinospica acidithermotolerans]MBR7826510.1 sugar phosphate isomerase/epimerase [Actinospica acidithermotolerans]
MTDHTAEQLSLNVWTTKGWSLGEAVAGCVEQGVPGIGLWRDKVAEHGLEASAKLVREAGLTVTSLCRGGFFTSPDWQADNHAAVDECVALGTDVLVLVVGGLPSGSRDLAAARAAVTDGIAELAPYAESRGVKLAIEPLHPMFCADRAVVSTLGQALDIADEVAVRTGCRNVGVCVDTYHIWWDPQVFAQIERAGAAGRILAFQVCDFLIPIPADALLGRGHVGDGVIDIASFVRAVREAGYKGFIEVEIFNQEIWDTPGDQTLRTVIDRHTQLLAELD